MRILYIHQHFSTNDGATGTRSFDYARYLVKKGHEVIMLCGDCGIGGLPVEEKSKRLIRRIYIEGIQVVVAGIPYSNNMGFTQRVFSFLAFSALGSFVACTEKKIDVVFATSTPLTVGIPALLCRWLRGVRYVFEVRDIWPEMLINAGLLKNSLVITIAEFAEKLFYRNASRVLGISRGIVNRLGKKGVPENKLGLLYTGVDTALYNEALPSDELLRSNKLGGKFVAIYAGSHGVLNGLDFLLSTAKLLEGSDISLLLIGSGKDKKRLVRDAEAQNINNILFLDSIPKTELLGLLKACNAGLMILADVPDFKAAMPNKFFDYLAAKLPVFVNFSGELADEIQKANCGDYVENPEKLANELKTLAANPERWEEMRKMAFSLVEQKYDRSKLVDVLEKHLSEVAGSTKKALTSDAETSS